MPITSVTALNLLQNAKRAAFFPRAADDLDSVAAALALAETLSVKGVETRVILEAAPSHIFNFLDTWKHAITDLDQRRELTIEIPTDQAAVQSISYERQPNKLLIHLSPSKSAIPPEVVRIRSQSATLGDVLVTIGVRRPQELGKRFTERAELFYQKPTVAIDYHIDLENFATVTIADPTARSASVLALDLIKQLPGSLSKPVATTLLAGILAKTASFQREMTSPREFEAAATLLDHGADRHAVVHHLYKTKPLPTLKLWGRLLARLVADPLERAWSVLLTTGDFTETGTKPQVLAQVVREVLASSAQAELITVTYELPGNQSGVLAASPRGPLARALFDRLSQQVRTNPIEHNDHFMQTSVKGNAQQVYALVRQLGEQITRPGYTGYTQHAQRITQTRRAPVPAAQRAPDPQREPAAPAIRRR